MHHAQPGVVSITQPTELGTLYTIDEIRAVCDTAHDMGLLVHVDGARIANATAALGGTRATLREMLVETGVDAVSFGGTKIGALGAEAVVFLNRDCAVGSEFLRKQVTQLASKMRYLAAQFNALLDDDLWLKLGIQANNLASTLYEEVADLPGVEVSAPEVKLHLPDVAGRDHQAAAGLEFLLGLGSNHKPGPVDDRLGHHPRRRQTVCRRGASTHGFVRSNNIGITS